MTNDCKTNDNSQISVVNHNTSNGNEVELVSLLKKTNKSTTKCGGVTAKRALLSDQASHIQGLECQEPISAPRSKNYTMAPATTTSSTINADESAYSFLTNLPTTNIETSQKDIETISNQNHKIRRTINLVNQSNRSQPQQQQTPKKPQKPRRRVATLAQRRAANIRERRRMFNLNAAFDRLRKKVPSFAYEKRLSRIETLKLAIMYIKFMDDLVNDDAYAEKYKQLTANTSAASVASVSSSLLSSGSYLSLYGHCNSSSPPPPPPAPISDLQQQQHTTNVMQVHSSINAPYYGNSTTTRQANNKTVYYDHHHTSSTDHECPKSHIDNAHSSSNYPNSSSEQFSTTQSSSHHHVQHQLDSIMSNNVQQNFSTLSAHQEHSYDRHQGLEHHQSHHFQEQQHLTLTPTHSMQHSMHYSLHPLQAR